jgi:hypothetical protein
MKRSAPSATASGHKQPIYDGRSRVGVSESDRRLSQAALRKGRHWFYDGAVLCIEGRSDIAHPGSEPRAAIGEITGSWNRGLPSRLSR